MLRRDVVCQWRCKCCDFAANLPLMLEHAQAGVPSSGAPAAAAQQWGDCSVLPQASGLELCGAGPQEAGLGPGAGASLDGATASALLAALVNSSAAGTTACAFPKPVFMCYIVLVKATLTVGQCLLRPSRSKAVQDLSSASALQ